MQEGGKEENSEETKDNGKETEDDGKEMEDEGQETEDNKEGPSGQGQAGRMRGR